MDKEIYIATQQQILLLVALIKDLPLPDFLDEIDRCETIAPLIDPTLYIQGAEKLEVIKTYGKALRAAQKIIKGK